MAWRKYTSCAIGGVIAGLICPMAAVMTIIAVWLHAGAAPVSLLSAAGAFG